MNCNQLINNFVFDLSISCISEIINKKTYKWVWEELENGIGND